jgi:Haem-dependent oxidative N-demethylase, alpha subunit-like
MDQDGPLHFAEPCLPYVPFLDGPGEFRWRLGVRPLDPDEWIELRDDAEEAIAEKKRLCRDHHDDVFVALPDVEEEAGEVAAALVDHLRRRWPDRYGDARLDPGLHPLDAAARLVPEDLVLMVERPVGGVPALVFGAGSVCFPNRWDLRSKLGRTLPEVHAPVPRLNAQLERPIDRFLEHLRPERGYWRLGWGIIDVGDRYTPPGRARPGPGAVGPLDRYVRVERETLRRFPTTSCVLFTIRTYIRPLAELAADPRVAARLAEQVTTMAADVRGYKDLDEIGDDLVESLRS